MPFTYGAVVVTYFPTDSQIANIEDLATSCPQLCVIDNSPQAGGWHRRLVDAGITVLHNHNRGGIAGAFNRGFAELEARGLELFFVLDQDSHLPPGYFDAMVQAAVSANERGQDANADNAGQSEAFMIGPLIHDLNLGALLPQFGLDGKRMYAIDLQTPTTEPLLSCALMISSGSMVSRAAWKKIGRFDERYVIDHIDTDYCMRALACGVPRYLNPHVTLRHRLGEIKIVKFFGLKIPTLNHAASRRYYMARNALNLSLTHARACPAILTLNIFTLMQIVPVLLFESDRLRKSCALMLGFFDGLFGRLGSVQEAHPALGRYISGAAVTSGGGGVVSSPRQASQSER